MNVDSDKASLLVPLSEIMGTRLGSIDPSRYSDETFELYSIPSYDAGNSEILLGSEIGSAKQILNPGDVLISKIVPHIRRTWVVGESKGYRILGSGEWIVFRNDCVDNSYLRLILKSDPFHREFMKTVSGIGGSLLRARPSSVATIKIPFPPLDDQKRIAYLLGKVEGLIAQRKQHLQQLDTLLKSVFLEMFGDPIKNEKGWERYSFSSLFSAPPLIGTTTPATDDGDIPVVRVGEIGEMSIKIDRCKKVRLSDHAFEKCKVSVGDILLARAIGSVEHLGKASLIQAASNRIAFDSHVMRIRFKAELLDPLFSYMWLRSDGGRRLFLSASSQTSVQFNINSKQIASIEMPLPPLPFQQQFGAVVEKVEGIKSRYQQSLGDLESLYGALSQKAFAGDLDLSRVSL